MMMTRLTKISHFLWAVAVVMWICVGVSHAVQTGGPGVTNPDVIPHGALTYRSATGLYQLFVILSPTAVGLGPTAPPLATCGSDNGGEDVIIGLEFDTTARRAFFPTNVLPCWDSTRDVFFQMYFVAEDDDPFAEGETFNWAFDYRATNILDGDGWETGTLATVSETYTQPAVGAGVECSGGLIIMTLPRAGVGGNQDYGLGYAISGALRKVAGGTYSGNPFIGAVLWFLPIVEECLW